MTFSTDQENPAPLQRESKGPLVRILKNYLRALGHYRGESGEDFDEPTENAVKDFKKEAGIGSTDGSVDNGVWNALIEKTSDIFLPTQIITKAIDSAINQAKATDGAITTALRQAIDSTITTAINAATSTTVDPATNKKGAIVEAIDSAINQAKATDGAITTAIGSAITTAKSTTVDPATQKKGAIIEAIDSTITTAINAATSTTVDPVTNKKGAIIEAIDSAINQATSVDPVTQKKGAIVEAIDSAITTAITTAKSTTVDPATNKKGAIVEAIDSTITTAITTAKSTTVDPVTQKKGAIIEAIDSTLTTAKSTTVDPVTQKKGAIVEAIDSAIAAAKSTEAGKEGVIIQAIDQAVRDAKSIEVGKEGAITRALNEAIQPAVARARVTERAIRAREFAIQANMLFHRAWEADQTIRKAAIDAREFAEEAKKSARAHALQNPGSEQAKSAQLAATTAEQKATEAEQKLTRYLAETAPLLKDGTKFEKPIQAAETAADKAEKQVRIAYGEEDPDPPVEGTPLSIAQQAVSATSEVVKGKDGKDGVAGSAQKFFTAMQEVTKLADDANTAAEQASEGISPQESTSTSSPKPPNFSPLLKIFNEPLAEQQDKGKDGDPPKPIIKPQPSSYPGLKKLFLPDITTPVGQESQTTGAGKNSSSQGGSASNQDGSTSSQDNSSKEKQEADIK